MGKLEATLRAEISRLAKREARRVCAPLEKQVRELKRTVSQLRRSAGPKAAAAAAKAAAPAPKLKATQAEVEKARFSPGLIKKLRKRLGVTQVELATLIDVSPTTVAFWEQGRNRPVDESKSALVALRKLGRRDVRRILDAKR